MLCGRPQTEESREVVARPYDGMAESRDLGTEGTGPIVIKNNSARSPLPPRCKADPVRARSALVSKVIVTHKLRNEAQDGIDENA
jgi:hypothetical protein